VLYCGIFQSVFISGATMLKLCQFVIRQSFAQVLFPIASYLGEEADN
jgi:hypothetical protein